MEMPKGFINHLILSGHGKEYQYWYKDSLVLYFTDEANSATLNYKNIEKQPEAKRKRFEAMMKKDTLLLEGQDDKNLHWKEIFLGNVIVGYMNVPEDKKKLFDKSLNSIHCHFSRKSGSYKRR